MNIDEYEQSSWKEPWGTPLRTREYLKLVISLCSIVSKVFAKSNYTTSTAVSFVLCLVDVVEITGWSSVCQPGIQFERLVAAEQQASLEDRVSFFIGLRYCVWQSDWSIVLNEGVVTLLIDDLIQLIFHNAGNKQVSLALKILISRFEWAGVGLYSTGGILSLVSWFRDVQFGGNFVDLGTQDVVIIASGVVDAGIRWLFGRCGFSSGENRF